MSVLKGFAASILSLLLFVALSAFATVFILNATVFNAPLMVQQVERLDVPAFLEESLAEQSGQVTPQQAALQRTIITNTATELEPWLKEQAAIVINAFESYLKGDSASVNVAIPLDRVKQSLAKNAREAIQKTPPPELAGLPQPLVDAYINEFAAALSRELPANFTLTEASLGPDTMSVLRQVRGYASELPLIMFGLIAAMVIMIALLYLVNRNVKQTSRDVGITFLMTGIIDYAAIYFGAKFSPALFDQAGLPASLRDWLPQVIKDFTQPALNFAIVVGIIGAALIAFSFVYGRRKPVTAPAAA